MSDASAHAPAEIHIRPRRSAVSPIVAAVLIAFLAGLALMAVLGARYRWGQPVASASSRPLVAVPVAARAVQPPLLVATDPATLAGRETLLAAQLSAIEARTQSVGAAAAAASGQANRAEAILIAFAARRAIDRGMRLGELEGPLRERFGAARPQALAVIEDASREPLTLDDLRDGLERLSPALVSGGGGWLSGLRRELGSLIVIHRADTPSPAPADRLARVRLLVATGRVDGALAEVSRMPGAPDAGNWIAAARRYIDVHHALDSIESAAIQGATTPPLAAAVVAAPASSPDAAPSADAPTAAVPPAITH